MPEPLPPQNRVANARAVAPDFSAPRQAVATRLRSGAPDRRGRTVGGSFRAPRHPLHLPRSVCLLKRVVSLSGLSCLFTLCRCCVLSPCRLFLRTADPAGIRSHCFPLCRFPFPDGRCRSGVFRSATPALGAILPLVAQFYCLSVIAALAISPPCWAVLGD